MAFNIMNVSNIEGVTTSGNINGTVTVIPTVAANTIIKIKRLSFSGSPIHKLVSGFNWQHVESFSDSETTGKYNLGDGWVRLNIARVFSQSYPYYLYNTTGSNSQSGAVSNTASSGDVLENVYVTEGKSLQISGTLDFSLSYEIWS